MAEPARDLIMSKHDLPDIAYESEIATSALPPHVPLRSLDQQSPISLPAAGSSEDEDDVPELEPEPWMLTILQDDDISFPPTLSWPAPPGAHLPDLEVAIWDSYLNSTEIGLRMMHSAAQKKYLLQQYYFPGDNGTDAHTAALFMDHLCNLIDHEVSRLHIERGVSPDIRELIRAWAFLETVKHMVYSY